MRKYVLAISIIVFVFPLKVSAGSHSEQLIEQIDALFTKGIAENYQQSGMDMLKQSLDLSLKSLNEAPENYEILWRCSRSAGEYAEAAMILKEDGWKGICSHWGKKGMNLAEKAQKIAPERVEAYYWQIQNIGKYADATSILTAVKEGFIGKMKRNLKKSYEIDKSYHDYSPVFVNSLFNYELPWPLKDKKKALKYYEEFVENADWNVDCAKRYTDAAKFLLSMKGEKYKNEAKKLIETTLADPHPRLFYKELAIRLLSKME